MRKLELRKRWAWIADPGHPGAGGNKSKIIKLKRLRLEAGEWLPIVIASPTGYPTEQQIDGKREGQ